MNSDQTVGFLREHDIGRDGVVTVATGSDSVVVRGVDGTIARILDATADDTELETRALPGRFEVRTGRPRLLVLGIRLSWSGWGSPRGSAIHLEVPRTARLEVSTASGDIKVEGLVESVTVRSASGDVSLRQVAGKVGAETASGDVGIDSNGGLESRVTTVSGDTRLGAPRLVRTAVTTVSGDISVEGRPDPAGEHVVESTSGDIRLALAGGTTVTARTVSGDIRAAAPARRDGGGRRGPVVLGDGAAQIVVRTLSGDITVGAAPARGPAAGGATHGEAGRPVAGSAGRGPDDAGPSMAVPLASATASPNPPPMPVPPARLFVPAAPEPPAAPVVPVAPVPPAGPTMQLATTPKAKEPAGGEGDSRPEAAGPAADPTLELLEALARGDIDVEEADRRLAQAHRAASAATTPATDGQVLAEVPRG